MAKPTQQDLMAAHNAARNNSEKAAVVASKNATVVDQVDPYRKIEPLADNEHPFGGNSNNQRVAQRILRDSQRIKSAPIAAPLTPAQAAANDLAKAAAIDAETEPVLTDKQQEAAADAATAAALAAKQEAARIAALPDDNPEKIAAKAATPPPPPPPPAWKQNA